MKKLTLCILGAPGSGKGTQARILAKKFHLKHIELGNLIRHFIKTNQAAQKRYQKGLPQPDSLIEGLLEKEIRRASDARFIFDPFPLTEKQILILKRLVDKFQLAPAQIIYLKTDPKMVFQRLLKRGENRADDNPEIAKRRIQLYQKTLSPVLRQLKKTHQLIVIDGNPPIRTVTTEILHQLSIK